METTANRFHRMVESLKACKDDWDGKRNFCLSQNI